MVWHERQEWYLSLQAADDFANSMFSSQLLSHFCFEAYSGRMPTLKAFKHPVLILSFRGEHFDESEEEL
jgi:hypothetical protein